MKKSLAKKIKRLTAHDLLVTPKYTQWLETAEARDAVYPEWVIERIADELRAHDRDRTQSFSPSSAGKCRRRQVFEFLGADAKDFDMDTIAIFLTGNWNHYMWQAGMLASGAIEDIELALPMPEFRSMGTGDGYGTHEEHGEFGWEHKSISGRNFKFVLANDAPQTEHLYQAHRYMLASGLRLWSVTYDCKEDQDWKEFVIPFDSTIGDEVMDELIDLNEHVEDERLPEVLEKCKFKEGPFRGCPFRHVCLDAEPEDFEFPDDGHQIADVLAPQPRRIRLPQHPEQRKLKTRS